MALIAVSEDDQKIGATVRTRRESLHITQGQLAHALGISFQQVQKYERGTNRISAATALNMADALECHVTDLYGFPDPKAKTVSERAILALWKDLRPAEQNAVVAMVREFLKP
ncbi:helix-turn-helix domain-containing protein [Brevundimonas sp. Marseille-Q4549]